MTAAARTRPLLLVVRALGLGDLLTGVPALRALARSFPDHERVLLAPAGLAPLLALVHAPDGAPVVDRVVDHHGLQPIDATWHRAAVAVNLHGRGPESRALLRATAPDRLVAWADGPPGPRWRAGEHEVDRWCRLLDEHGIPAEPTELRIARPDAAPQDRRWAGATVIHPGAAAASRRWPAERWAGVARAERAAGRAVLLTGGPAERDLAAWIATRAGLPCDSVVAGATDLLRLAALVGAAGSLASGDTGVAHLATALGTPSVTLFGPVAPAAWGPYPAPPERRRRHAVLWARRPGDPPGDPHADRCDPVLARLEVDDVLTALAALPAAS